MTMSFPEFTQALAEELGLRVAIHSAQDSLVECLGLDSLQVILAITWAEDEAGSVFPEQLICSLTSVGDLYATYASHAPPNS